MHCDLLQYQLHAFSLIRSLMTQGSQSDENHMLCTADGVPPVTQTRHLPANVEMLPEVSPGESGYRYVIFHWLFITITQRSLQLAKSTACLTFTALQVSHFDPLFSAELSVSLRFILALASVLQKFSMLYSARTTA